jgi:ATP-dependent Clp protease ATP-binding subunit ClpC
MKMEPSIVMKYCPVIDEFLKIRIFSEEEIVHLLHSTQIRNRTDYQQLVVNACVVQYNDAVLPKAREHGNVSNLEEVIYQYCVEANPALDINRVVIPVTHSREAGALHLLERTQHYLKGDGLKRLRGLEEEINKRVIGQREAVSALASAIRKAAVGIRNLARPIGTFLFVGQTGVGKTELSRALAECLYGDEGKFVKIDCSEFALPHEYAKLIGAPPGYIGHDEGGQLTEAIRRKGEAVVLFDEIEKADTKIHNLLLQILDEGVLTDSKGKQTSFSECVIILTSNLGAKRVEQLRHRIGFSTDQNPSISHRDRRRATIESIKEYFRPEFINRLNDILVFRSLEMADIERIAELRMADVTRYARRVELTLHADPLVTQKIAQEGFHADYGAREIQRTVERLIEIPLAEKVIDGQFRKGDHVRVGVRKGAIVFTRARAAAARNQPAAA